MQGRKEYKAIVACATSATLLPIAIHFVGPIIGIALSPAIAVFCHWGPRLRTALAAWLTGTVASFLIQHTLWIVHIRAVALLSVYQAFTWIPVALGVATVWHRWRIPLTVSWPLAWTAGEALRALGPFGTIFGILPVPKTTELWMLQIADLGGYGMATLPLAMIQGWFADLILGLNGSRRAFLQDSRFAWATAFLAITWTSVAVYGHWRLRDVQSTLRPGPTIAVIDPDILPDLAGKPSPNSSAVLRELQTLSEAAVQSTPRPELVVWPEGIATKTVPSESFFDSPFDPRMASLLSHPHEDLPSNSVLRQRWETVRQSASEYHQAFREWVDRLGTTVLVGSEAWVRTTPDQNEPFNRYNAALPFHPEEGQGQNFQAKARLYPLGETAPWKNTPLAPHFTKLLGPPLNDFSCGHERSRFKFGPNGPSFVISLCSELKFSSLRGKTEPAVKGTKPFDVMINMANESLFQHNRMGEIFAFCGTLRAIENRVPVVRSSNAGISGFYAPTGRAYGTTPPRTRLPHRATSTQSGSWSVSQIQTSERQTLFQRTGDWLTPSLIITLIGMNLAGSRPFRRIAHVKVWFRSELFHLQTRS